MFGFLGRRVRLRDSATVYLGSYALSTVIPNHVSISGDGNWMALTDTDSTVVRFCSFPDLSSSDVWDERSLWNSYARLPFAWSYSGDRVATFSTNTARVNVITNSDGVFTAEQTLQPSIGLITWSTGSSLDMSDKGDVIVVGYPRASYSSGGFSYTEIGAILVWRRSGTVWSSTTILAPASLGNNSYFGSTVGISGDGNTISVSGITVAGISSVYTYTYDGSWNDAGRGVLSSGLDMDGLSDTGFGVSLSLNYDGSVLVVGAPLWDTGTGAGNNDVGAVFKYYLSNNVWSGANNDNSYILNRTNSLLLPSSSLFGGGVRVDGTGDITSVVSKYGVFVFNDRSLEGQKAVTNANGSIGYPYAMDMSTNGRRIVVPNNSVNTGLTFFRR